MKQFLKKPTPGKQSASNLIHDANKSFYKYYGDIEKYDNLSFKSKYFFRAEYFNDLNKSNTLKTQK